MAHRTTTSQIRKRFSEPFVGSQFLRARPIDLL
jgi:hypothetical protein